MMHQYSKYIKSIKFEQTFILGILIMAHCNSILAGSTICFIPAVFIDGEKANNEDLSNTRIQKIYYVMPTVPIYHMPIQAPPEVNEALLTEEEKMYYSCIHEIEINRYSLEDKLCGYILDLIQIAIKDKSEPGYRLLRQSEALYNLGVFYQCGCHRLHNTLKAKFWYEKAAALGHDEAKHNLEHFS